MTSHKRKLDELEIEERVAAVITSKLNEYQALCTNTAMDEAAKQIFKRAILNSVQSDSETECAAEEEFQARKNADKEEAKEAERKSQATKGEPEAQKRVHKKIGDYKEGAALVSEITEFFRLNFKESINIKVMLSEISKMFVQSRKTPTKLQANLFRRHSKRLFLATWPNAVYSMHKNNKCFLHVGINRCHTRACGH